MVLSKDQLKKLEEMCLLHQCLYNAALQQRIEAYQRQGVSLKFSDQCRELTVLRKECPEYGELNAQSCQVTLKRLELAFQNFFRRIKEGAEKVGFPRFKSAARFKGFGYKSHGDGFRIVSNGKHGTVRLSGIGVIKLRGKARTWGEPITSEILRKNNRWYLSVTVECKPQRILGKKAIAFDWGVETYLTLAKSDDSFEKIKNPRFLKKALKDLKKAQQGLSRKTLGSRNRDKARKKVAKSHHRVSSQRKNFAHQVSARVVKEGALLVTEQLNIKGMTAEGGRRKRGLNREILNTAPATLISLLKYKAEEAGAQWNEVPTREVKPSQTCAGCGHREKKPLSERTHDCKECGLKLGRDENSARVMLNWALTRRASGWEPARCGEATLVVSMKQETPTIPA